MKTIFIFGQIFILYILTSCKSDLNIYGKWEITHVTVEGYRTDEKDIYLDLAKAIEGSTIAFYEDQTVETLSIKNGVEKKELKSFKLNNSTKELCIFDTEKEISCMTIIEWSNTELKTKIIDLHLTMYMNLKRTK